MPTEGCQMGKLTGGKSIRTRNLRIGSPLDHKHHSDAHVAGRTSVDEP